MSASYEHPTLRMPVTTEQRDRAAEHLQGLYAEGRITEEEFDRRIGQVLGAENRKQLNDAFYGLVEVPTAAPTTNYYPAASTYSRTPASRVEPSPGGALAHFSALFTGMIIGPAIGYAVSKPGSIARKESAKAFNFQLISLIGLIIGGTLTAVTNWGIINFLVGLGTLAWFILTIVGGVKAAQGADWQNPVKKVIKLDVLPEK
ncbi:DUF1707 and DUF4870 domain-containing protein [Microlunatus elymi]|nr:DUF1707 and DUF4870 domain-containing protein [Microlunatus elymi]